MLNCYGQKSDNLTICQFNNLAMKQTIAPKDFSALKLSFQFGYIIVIPLVIFALSGVFLDRYLKTSPLFLFIGIILSIIISTIGIYRTILPFLEISKKSDSKDKK